VGRICSFRSLPDHIDLFIDMTAEFPTPRSIRESVEFVCLPTVDGCPPTLEDVGKGFAAIGTEPRRIYICCANGCGRSVTFTAALLGHRGVCHSCTEAVAFIKSSRSVAAPNADQWSFLDEFYKSLN
jgi:protein-tyrosine phosphatase